ncbi:MAG: flagellar hook-associated protein FlgK [Gammaproteobacteria bacterium]|nr:MAG: flagellar hook-associated protein FlgK [Gammaproteobacteria bacterium]
MGNFLNIGISGLLSAQSAIATTSNNIANINTEGYNRQIISFDANTPNFFGGSYIGTGVVINNVERVIDSLSLLDLRSNITNFNSLETFVSQADRVDRIVADPTTGLSPAIQGFFDSIQAVANTPGSTAARQSLFSQTDLVIERFKILDNQLNTQRISINNELQAVAGQVTTLGQAIADINRDIVAALGASASGGQPNDLLDKRDQLVNELSKLVKVSVIEQRDGSNSIFIGNGQTLVIGLQANELRAEADPADPLNSRLVIIQGNQTIPVTNQLVGGKLGGLIDYRNEMLKPAINRLGLVALGLSSNINAQHQLGMELNGQVGGLFFSDINSATSEANRVKENVANAGTAQVTLTISDVDQVSVDDYRLEYSAGTTTFTLINTKDNSVVDSFLNPGVPGSRIVAGEGITINFTAGVVADGDSFLVTPTREAVGGLNKAITDLTQIAAASPMRGVADIANTGSAEITGTQVTDTTNASFSVSGSLNPPVRIVFTGPTTYSVLNDTTSAVLAAGITFTANQENNMLSQAGLSLGYEIQIGGAAVIGDTFRSEYNTGGIGDNSNALAMADIQSQKVINNGNSTIQESYGLLVSEVGTRTNEGQISLGAAQSLLRQTEARVQSISGVNLDEEAAKLIKFQQSYQASAQIISTATIIFDTLIAAVR